MNKDILIKRLNAITIELLELFTSGQFSEYSNKDIVTYIPGTIQKIQDLISRRNEIIGLIKSEDNGS